MKMGGNLPSGKRQCSISREILNMVILLHFLRGAMTDPQERLLN